MGNLIKETPYSEITATLELFDRYEVTREHFTRLRSNKVYAESVIKEIVGTKIKTFLAARRVKAIMSPNFFGAEHWQDFYGIFFNQNEIPHFPWKKEVLDSPCPFVKGKSVKETHFAFLGIPSINGKPLTILEWHKLHPAWSQLRFHSYAPNTWYANHYFAETTTLSFRWYLMPLVIVPNSTDKTYQKQVAMLPTDYEVPYAIEEITKFILFHRKNIKYPNTSHVGRCQDAIIPVDGCVDVGRGPNLLIEHHLGDEAFIYIGLAASRKLPESE